MKNMFNLLLNNQNPQRQFISEVWVCREGATLDIFRYNNHYSTSIMNFYWILYLLPIFWVLFLLSSLLFLIEFLLYFSNKQRPFFRLLTWSTQCSDVITKVFVWNIKSDCHSFLTSSHLCYYDISNNFSVLQWPFHNVCMGVTRNIEQVKSSQEHENNLKTNKKKRFL